MKKVMLVFSAFAFSVGASAQKAKIYTAKEYMKDGDMKKAISVIDEAVNSDATRNSGEAWFTRGEIFERMGDKDSASIEESKNSYLKVVEVDPKFDKQLINSKLSRIAKLAYNKGVEAYNAQNYAAAEKYYGSVAAIYGLNGGKQFAGDEEFKKIAISAQRFEAYSAVSRAKDEHAISLLEKIKSNPDFREPYTYVALIDAYAEKKDNAAVERTIAEGKTAYPKDEQINARELNYYANSGDNSMFIKKLEESAQKDPNNAILQFNLAVAYGNAASPRDTNGTLLNRPANAKELEQKAETAYKLAIDADPSNTDYVYNLGAFYYNKAADITTRMNELGTSEAENRKYDEMKAARTREYQKALPHLQKAYDILSVKKDKKTINQDQLQTYMGALVALQAIYDDFGQKDKSAIIAAKLDELTNSKK